MRGSGKVTGCTTPEVHKTPYMNVVFSDRDNTKLLTSQENSSAVFFGGGYYKGQWMVQRGSYTDNDGRMYEGPWEEKEMDEAIHRKRRRVEIQARETPTPSIRKQPKTNHDL